MQPKEYTIQDEAEYLARLKVYEIEGAKLPFLHLEFKKWTPSSFKKLLHSWKHFRKFIKGPLFAIHNGADDDKWRKFVERLGFTYFRNVDCPDGINRRCFISQDNADG
jgi:hypothetical protein